MVRKQFEEGLTSAAFGMAPDGAQPQGQPAGEMFPGNGRMSIDRSNPNPAERDLRIDALYQTIESRDMGKARAGERMAEMLNSRGRY
jgi:hypothetical protein